MMTIITNGRCRLWQTVAIPHPILTHLVGCVAILHYTPASRWAVSSFTLFLEEINNRSVTHHAARI